MITADDVVVNLAALRDRISAAGGDPDSITVVGVTKDQPREAVDAALGAGMIDLAENRADALVEAATRNPQARWHYLAAVQRNKVARLAPHVALWQTVDRLEAGEAIASHCPGAAVLVQVNLSEDNQRAGCDIGAAPALVGHLRDEGLDVRGVMAVGPLGSPDAVREGFRAVRRVADQLGLAVRSLGMSGDLEIAVAEGTTMLRIGAALFGPRLSANRARH